MKCVFWCVFGRFQMELVVLGGLVGLKRFCELNG